RTQWNANPRERCVPRLGRDSHGRRRRSSHGERGRCGNSVGGDPARRRPNWWILSRRQAIAVVKHVPPRLFVPFGALQAGSYASNLNRVSARRYIGRHTMRLTVTTIAAMRIVAASSKGKFPASVAWLIVAPSPMVEIVSPFRWKYSATMLAFHAPPAAVTKPVTRYGNIPGRIKRRHLSQPLNRNTSAASFRSVGIAIAPAMTLNSTYHWVPNSRRMIDPIPSPPPARISSNRTTGNSAVAGTDA